MMTVLAQAAGGTGGVVAGSAVLAPPRFPIVTDTLWQVVVIAAAYVVTLSLSGTLVKFFVLPRGLGPPKQGDPRAPRPRFDTGTVIGKCENILTVTLVLMGQFSGLGLILTAKTLARSEQIKENPGYFLGGTLVNLVWALGVGLAARLLVIGA